MFHLGWINNKLHRPYPEIWTNSWYASQDSLTSSVNDKIQPSMFKQNYRWWNSYTYMIVKFYILIFLFHDHHLVFKDSNNYINCLWVYDFCRLPSIIVIRGSKVSNFIPKRRIKLLKYLTKQSKIEDITLNLANP